MALGLQTHSEANSVEALLKGAGPELYRRNAFRLTGLRVDANAREIGRIADKLKTLEKFSQGGIKLGGALPLHPPPQADEVREAVQRLRDPEQRLIDEFFWFWPLELGQGKQDAALQLLARNEVREANQLWMKAEREGSHGCIAKHNVAVLAHALALDCEHAARGTEIAEAGFIERRDRFWQEAFPRWHLLIADDAFWQRLGDRIVEFNDARLVAALARRMANTLPQALLSINARMAAGDAAKGLNDEVDRHILLIQKAGFNQAAVDEALAIACAAPREQIGMLCKNAEEEGKREPERAARVATSLLDTSHPLLQSLDRLLPRGHSKREGAHDLVASTVLTCQVGYANKTQDWETSEVLLRRAAQVANGAALVARIQDNLKVVESNAEKHISFKAPGYSRLTPPIAAELANAKHHADAHRWTEALSILEILLDEQDADRPGEGCRDIIAHALAFCLSSKAMEMLETILGKAQKNAELLQQLIAKVSANPLEALRSIVTCPYCNRSIFTGESKQFQLKDIPVPITLHDSCAKELMSIDGATLGRAFGEAIDELECATELAPQCKGFRARLDEVRNGAKQSGISPTPPQAQIRRVPIDKGELIPVDQVVCWFCDQPIDNKAPSSRIDFYKPQSVTRRGRSKVVKFESGHVSVPRCRECEKRQKPKLFAKTQIRPGVWAAGWGMGIVGALGSGFLGIYDAPWSTGEKVVALGFFCAVFSVLSACALHLLLGLIRWAFTTRTGQIFFSLWGALLSALGTAYLSEEASMDMPVTLGASSVIGIIVFLLFFALARGLIMRLFLRPAATRSPRKVIFPKEHAHKHPAVLELLERGWQIGLHP